MHLHKMHKYHKMYHHMMHHRGPPRFSDTEDEALINAVKNFPALYDGGHEDHKNGKVKTDIWYNISLSLGRDVDTCKRRWKDMKDNYYKIIRKHKIDSCKWQLFGKLSFLDSNVHQEKRTEPSFDKEYPSTSFENSSVRPDVNVGENNERTSDNLPPISLKKNSKQQRRVNAEMLTRTSRNYDKPKEDDVDLFMQSIAMQVKKLPPKLAAQAKLSILTAVHELQFETATDNTHEPMSDQELISI